MEERRKRHRIFYLENGQGYGGAVICLELLLQALSRDHYEPFVSASYIDKNYRRLMTIAPFFFIPKRFFDKSR